MVLSVIITPREVSQPHGFYVQTKVPEAGIVFWNRAVGKKQNNNNQGAQPQKCETFHFYLNYLTIIAF